MLSCMNDVERMCHAAATMLYHHGSDTRTIAACVRGLQGFRERWTAPTIMDGPDASEAQLERVKVVKVVAYVACVCGPVCSELVVRVCHGSTADAQR